MHCHEFVGHFLYAVYFVSHSPLLIFFSFLVLTPNRATELDRIDNTFRHVQEERAGIDGKREKLSDTMESQAAKVKVLKEKLDQFKAVEKLEAKRLNMESGFAWAFFGERDQDYQAKLTVCYFF